MQPLQIVRPLQTVPATMQHQGAVMAVVPLDQQQNAQKRKRERKSEVKGLQMVVNQNELALCISKKSKSGYKGVQEFRSGNRVRYQAQEWNPNTQKREYLGQYDTREEAAMRALEYRKSHPKLASCHTGADGETLDGSKKAAKRQKKRADHLDVNKAGVVVVPAQGLMTAQGMLHSQAPLAIKAPPAMNVKLTYLNLPGLGEPIRLALYINNVNFQDERIDYNEIARRRAAGELPHGQVPVLSADGMAVLSQSTAILRWASRQGDLWPETVQSQSHYDMVEAAVTELNYLLRPQWYGHVMGRSPITGELLVPMTQDQIEQTAKALNEQVLPAKLRMLENCILGMYFCGPQMTGVDLLWYCMGQGLMNGTYCAGVSVDVMATCPKLVQLTQRIHAHPRVMEWHARMSVPVPAQLPAVAPHHAVPAVYDPRNAYPAHGVPEVM